MTYLAKQITAGTLVRRGDRDPLADKLIKLQKVLSKERLDHHVAHGVGDDRHAPPLARCVGRLPKRSLEHVNVQPIALPPVVGEGEQALAGDVAAGH